MSSQSGTLGTAILDPARAGPAASTRGVCHGNAGLRGFESIRSSLEAECESAGAYLSGCLIENEAFLATGATRERWGPRVE